MKRANIPDVDAEIPGGFPFVLVDSDSYAGEEAAPELESADAFKVEHELYCIIGADAKAQVEEGPVA